LGTSKKGDESELGGGGKENKLISINCVPEDTKRRLALPVCPREAAIGGGWRKKGGGTAQRKKKTPLTSGKTEIPVRGETKRGGLMRKGGGLQEKHGEMSRPVGKFDGGQRTRARQDWEISVSLKK